MIIVTGASRGLGKAITERLIEKGEDVLGLVRSVNDLGIDAIDLYYIHRRDPVHEIEDVTNTLAGFVKAGKIKAFGFSEIAPSSLRRAHAVHPVAAVQSEYSLSTRSPELGLVQACEEIGALLVAFSPVGRALLTDRPHQADAVSKMEFMKGNPRFVEPNLSTNVAATANFRQLAADKGVAAGSLAIAWLVHQGDHVLPIPGTRQIAHLREVAEGGTLDLTSDDLTGLAKSCRSVGHTAIGTLSDNGMGPKSIADLHPQQSIVGQSWRAQNSINASVHSFGKSSWTM